MKLAPLEGVSIVEERRPSRNGQKRDDTTCSARKGEIAISCSLGVIKLAILKATCRNIKLPAWSARRLLRANGLNHDRIWHEHSDGTGKTDQKSGLTFRRPSKLTSGRSKITSFARKLRDKLSAKGSQGSWRPTSKFLQESENTRNKKVSTSFNH